MRSQHHPENRPSYRVAEHATLFNPDWALLVCLLSLVSSGFASLEAYRQNIALNNDPNYQPVADIRADVAEINDLLKDFTWGRVPDLATLLDEVEDHSGTQLGQQLSDAAMYGSELPAGAPLEDLSAGQQRDAAYAQAALQSADLYAEIEEDARLAALPPPTREAKNKADVLAALGLAGIAGSLVVGLSAIAEKLNRRNFRPPQGRFL